MRAIASASAVDRVQFRHLAISDVRDFVYGQAPRPVHCGRGVDIGCGTVLPEINFTLPPIDINEQTWPEIRAQYAEVIKSVCERAVALDAPPLLVEFETLPPMTIRAEWGLEIISLLAGRILDSTVYSEHHPDSPRAKYMIRRGDFKYRYYVNDIAELYDLRKDPKEMNNLALLPSYRSKVAEMKTQLFAWHSPIEARTVVPVDFKIQQLEYEQD